MKTFLPSDKYTPQETAMLQDIVSNNIEIVDVLRKHWYEVGLTDKLHITFGDITIMISDLTPGTASLGYLATRAILGFIIHELSRLVNEGKLMEGAGLYCRNDEEFELIHKSEEVFTWLLKQ